jgi:Cof subfamily protein (haloacid dehalogenase superfamily)
MLNYKLISIDLDGTLLNSSMHVSPENQQAIKEIKDKVFLVPNTGRSFGELPQELKEDTNIRYYISSDGADIYDKYTGERIFLGLDRDVFERVYTIVKEYDVYLMLHTDGNCYVDKKLCNEERMQEYNFNKYFIAHTFENCKTADSIENLINTVQKVELLVVFFKNLSDKELCWKRLENIGMHVSSSASGNIEVSAPNAGKGNGLIKLAKHLNVPISQTMAVGDNYNDLDMLLKAGLSVAVDNAKQEVKDKADITVCSNNEHVVSYLIKNLIKEI